MRSRVCFSRNSDEWGTPKHIIELVEKEFGPIQLDPCCTPKTAKAKKFFTKEQNGLGQEWKGLVFVNPPYSRIKEWVQKASNSCKGGAATVVMLIPARTDTRWFHEYIYGKAEIRFLKGRCKFVMNGIQSKENAPFPSMLVIFKH